MRKTPLKKRVLRSIKPRSNVDPTRMALAALDRIKTVLVRSDQKDRLGEALTMSELATQAQCLGKALPPSYVATMRVTSRIGEPEVFLSSSEMAAAAARIVATGGEESRRYAPFARAADALVCFDTGTGQLPGRADGELPIIEWHEGSATPIAAHFAEWLDAVADAREESVESAAKMPPRLKRLLYELGFRFEYPVIGRLETGDVDAVEVLMGPELARVVRADVDRLFDSSGKASLTLNVDEFTLAVSLRTGVYVFEAEDVFRWLRYFRDETFFGESVREPSHPDIVRDLRRAPREAPLVQRGVLYVGVLPAKRHVFRTATGASEADFYVLGRTASTSERASSLVLHVVDGAVAASHTFDEPLNHIHLALDATLWGLTTTHAVRLTDQRARAFPLERPTPGRPWWYGIGSAGQGRLVVWGAGALLEFDGEGFVPFRPDARLDPNEAVIAVCPRLGGLAMLVCGDRVGAVARFEGGRWLPIEEDHVIDAALEDIDVWRAVAYVLDREGCVWKVDKGPPRPVMLPTRHQSFLTEAGTPRPLHGVRAVEGGLLLASDGGVLVVGPGTVGGGAERGAQRAPEPLFHTNGGREPVRLVRLGGTGGDEATSVVALGGSHVWLWNGGGFSPIDMRDW